MTDKHTPGPWKPVPSAREGRLAIVHASGDAHIVAGPDGNAVAYPVAHTPTDHDPRKVLCLFCRDTLDAGHDPLWCRIGWQSAAVDAVVAQRKRPQP